MKAINFVVRNGMGATQRGEVGTEGLGTSIDAGAQNEISLNLRQADIQGYQRLGQDLQIVLADGRVVTLENFYSDSGAAANRLFISADGYLNEVELVASEGGDLYAQYGVTEQWGKWSPSDELISWTNRTSQLRTRLLAIPTTTRYRCWALPCWAVAVLCRWQVWALRQP